MKQVTDFFASVSGHNSPQLSPREQARSATASGSNQPVAELSHKPLLTRSHTADFQVLRNLRKSQNPRLEWLGRVFKTGDTASLKTFLQLGAQALQTGEVACAQCSRPFKSDEPYCCQICQLNLCGRCLEKGKQTNILLRPDQKPLAAKACRSCGGRVYALMYEYGSQSDELSPSSEQLLSLYTQAADTYTSCLSTSTQVDGILKFIEDNEDRAPPVEFLNVLPEFETQLSAGLVLFFFNHHTV